ncbi:hypothetical protein C0995_016018 [Termitomyces sp. Mi166|nr:hypothetical protein C0995_016018 [Termitomyces sp. Mi166\
MTRYWEPGTYYGLGDVVSYDGANYKIIQPHRSQSDWIPSVTPALWSRISDDDHGHSVHQQPEQCHPPIQQSPPTYRQHGDAQLQEYKHEEKPEQDEVDEPHKEHHWYEDKGKLGLAAIGGGVAAAVLGGGIHHLIKKHEEKEDEV